MSEQPEYTPPKVWTWDAESGGKFANINRPIAGPTSEKELPVGKHPFQLYSLATPNGVKETVMFEELLAAGHNDADYDAWIINIQEGDQFGSGFVDINPNSKIPALLDRSGAEPVRVFESASILMHLAEKFGVFLPASGAARTETLNWLFWQMGSATYKNQSAVFFDFVAQQVCEQIVTQMIDPKCGVDAVSRVAVAPWG